MRVFSVVLGLIALLSVGFSVAIHQGLIRLPPNLTPWANIQLEEEPRAFARLQVNSLASDAQACFAALNRSKLKYTRLLDRPLQNGCGIQSGIRFTQSHVAYKGASFDLTCSMGAALYWYEQRLDALAQEHLDTSLKRIVHFGSYACRNIYGRKNDRRSGHATGTAFDVGAFEMADGSSVTILKDWDDAGPKGRFLKAARVEACRFFNMVLSPDYNQAHANHFHLEMSRYRMCS